MLINLTSSPIFRHSLRHNPEHHKQVQQMRKEMDKQQKIINQMELNDKANQIKFSDMKSAESPRSLVPDATT